MDDEPDSAVESWQATRMKAAAAQHPVSDAILKRLGAAIEAEMMAKQMSIRELDNLSVELLAALKELPG